MILNSNALHLPLKDESVQCCITSPPYWGLRDYGVEGQLGLESTPEKYVANMVEVFREVRRVLKKDGVVWLNLGDSYAASTKGSGGHNPKRDSNKGAWHDNRRWSIPSGLKPKDLVGIPWRVAFALQQPQYTGRIKDERDRIWLAAMIEAEGCLFIHKRKIGQNNGQGYVRKNDSFGSGLEVSNRSEAIVRRCMEIAGIGSICTQGPNQNHRRKQTLFRWNARLNECREIIREVYPYLISKKHEARLLIGCPSSGPEAAAAHEALKGLHQGISTTVDFPEPSSMFEQGWWLRSDVIFSKPNPMPESVTDRPTKAHEYVFLLSKAARYFYDADAVREPQITPFDTKSHQTFGAPNGKAEFIYGKKVSGDQWQPSGFRNLRSVWTIATEPFPEAHFATFPEKLVETCIKAGSRPGDVVFDPFGGGSGRVHKVAFRLGRRAVTTELSLDYCKMAQGQRNGHHPLFVGI